MNTKANCLRADARATDTYLRAKKIFDEKRELLSKLSLLNQKLRDLQYLDADAVTAARLDVPFRNAPGRRKS